MKKNYVYNAWRKIKSNYLEISTLILFSILWLIIYIYYEVDLQSRLIKVGFPNLNSQTTIITSIFIILGSFLGILLINIVNVVDKKFVNIKDKLVYTYKYKHINHIRILSIFNILMGVALLIYINKYFLYFDIHNQISSQLRFGYNLPSIFLSYIIICLSFLTSLLILMIYKLFCKIPPMKKNKLEIQHKTKYLKSLILLNFIIYLIAFLYLSKCYLSYEHFNDIILGFITIHSKSQVLILTFTIIYIAINLLLVLSISYMTYVKINSIKNQYIFLLKEQNSTNKLYNYKKIKIAVILGIFISSSLLFYISKYFNKYRLIRYLNSDVQFHKFNNPTTTIILIVILCITTTLFIFLLLFSKITKDVVLIENNLDVISNNQEN